MEFVLTFYWMCLACNREDLAFAMVKFHKPFCFTVCKSI